MAEWTRLEVYDSSEFEALADAASAALETVASFFDAVAAVLDLISKIAIDDFDPIKAILAALVNELESAITDLLQNNAYTAVHVNLEWDASWRFDKKGDIYVMDGDPPRRRDRKDYVHDAALPWAGNGLGGWLDDLNASASDPRNVFRPVTDSETAVGGFIFILGVTSADELSSLKKLYEVFKSGWKDFHKIFDVKDALDEFTDEYKALSKLGSGIGDSFMKELVAVKEGMEGFLDPSNYLPTPGNYPIWASVPISQLIPPIHGIFQQLQKLIAQLSPAAGFSDILANLASFLAQKAETLADIAEELATLIQSLQDLLDLLNNGYFLWVEVDSGGFPAWVNAVRGADLVMDGDEIVGPDFGTNGIVAGMVGLATADDPLNHLQTMVRMVTGVTFEDTTQVQRLDDTFNEEFEE